MLVGRRARTASRVLPLLGVVLATATGCGFLNALAHPPAPHAEPIAMASPAAHPPPPPVIVDGDLQGAGGGAVGQLVVTLGRARTGLVPPVSNSEDCDFDPLALQYLPVEFASTVPGLAAHVEVSTGPATPTDIGDVGIFVQSSDGDQVHCADSPRLPTRDTFFNQAGARAITAWVVLGRAVTPATPDGRPEAFPTLQLRISDLREMHDATTVQRRLVPGALGIGAPCADDARAICVPLG